MLVQKESRLQARSTTRQLLKNSEDVREARTDPWNDDVLRQRLISDPEAVFAERGFDSVR